MDPRMPSYSRRTLPAEKSSHVASVSRSKLRLSASRRLPSNPYNIVHGHTRGPGGISASAQVVNTPDLRKVDRQRLRPAAHGPSMLRRQLMLCSAMATYLLWPRFHLGIYWENESRRHRHDMLIYFDPVLAI